MKVSVIIPVYNAQNSVSRAIESVLLQSHSEFELILVDDGSKDESLRVLYEYEEKYPCIKVFTQENAGPGAARNNGIAAATGDYVFFLDADDFLPPDALKHLVSVAHTYLYDVIKGIYYTKRNNKETLIKVPWSEGIVSRTGSEAERKRYHQIKTSSSFGYLWGTLYRKEFLKNSKVSLEEISLRFMEDTIFNLELFTCEPMYYAILEPVYVYVIQENSLSSRKDVDFFEQVRLVVEEYYEFLKRTNTYGFNLDLLVPLMARCFCWACVSILTNQKISFGMLRSKIKVFTESIAIQKILQEKALHRYLFSVESKAQAIVFYVFCLLLRWKCYGLIAFLFICLEKPMNLYIKSTLK